MSPSSAFDTYTNVAAWAAPARAMSAINMVPLARIAQVFICPPLSTKRVGCRAARAGRCCGYWMTSSARSSSEPVGRDGSVESPHLADDPPLGLRNWLDRQAREPGQRHAGEAFVRLYPVEADRCRELLHRGDVDGAPGGVGRIRMRLRDHPDDADDRALFPRV